MRGCELPCIPVSHRKVVTIYAVLLHSISSSISHTWLMSGTGAKKGQEGQTAAVSMLLLGYGAATPLLSDTNVHYLLLFIVYHGWAVLLLHHSVIA